MKPDNAPTQRELFLAEIECTVPWHMLRSLVEPVYMARFGRRPHRLQLDRKLRIFFLQRWFRLTDAAAREAICDSNAMRSFVCLSADAVPDESEICLFRRLLGQSRVAELVIHAAERHLRRLGIAVAPGAIVDAVLINTSKAHAQAPYARMIDTAGAIAG